MTDLRFLSELFLNYKICFPPRLFCLKVWRGFSKSTSFYFHFSLCCKCFPVYYNSRSRIWQSVRLYFHFPGSDLDSVHRVWLYERKNVWHAHGIVWLMGWTSSARLWLENSDSKRQMTVWHVWITENKRMYLRSTPSSNYFRHIAILIFQTNVRLSFVPSQYSIIYEIYGGNKAIFVYL